MVKKKHGVIIETPMEARQAEPGKLLLVSSENSDQNAICATIESDVAVS